MTARSADRVRGDERPQLRAAARRRTFVAWGFALPFTLVFLFFAAGPVLMSLGMSVSDISTKDLRSPLHVDLVGLENYRELFSDARFTKALGNTLIFVAVGGPITVLAALGAAVAINNGIRRFRGLFRVGYYIPVVTSIVAVAMVWRLLLQPEGLVNQFLAVLGVSGPNWLRDSTWALPSLMVMTAWRNLGTVMVILLAGLQSIPLDVQEAARVDGAGPWRRFWSIDFAFVRPALLFASVILGIAYLQFFEEAFVMTRGGPTDHTLSVAFYTYEQFGFGNYGLAAAASYVMFALIAALTAVQFRLLRQK